MSEASLPGSSAQAPQPAPSVSVPAPSGGVAAQGLSLQVSFDSATGKWTITMPTSRDRDFVVEKILRVNDPVMKDMVARGGLALTVPNMSGTDILELEEANIHSNRLREILGQNGIAINGIAPQVVAQPSVQLSAQPSGQPTTPWVAARPTTSRTASIHNPLAEVHNPPIRSAPSVPTAAAAATPGSEPAPLTGIGIRRKGDSYRDVGDSMIAGGILFDDDGEATVLLSHHLSMFSTLNEYMEAQSGRGDSKKFLEEMHDAFNELAESEPTSKSGFVAFGSKNADGKFVINVAALGEVGEELLNGEGITIDLKFGTKVYCYDLPEGTFHDINGKPIDPKTVPELENLLLPSRDDVAVYRGYGRSQEAAQAIAPSAPEFEEELDGEGTSGDMDEDDEELEGEELDDDEEEMEELTSAALSIAMNMGPAPSAPDLQPSAGPSAQQSQPANPLAATGPASSGVPPTHTSAVSGRSSPGQGLGGL